ncbi:hypothetical protein UCDDA912_g04717 [Diaporthe ampelina]|uniref:Uncharacterized protein n=1 Tax=Diaporthe ampelina TaxID=1214573 RepID=A0A0G2FLP6_9PEZI|nr:hypothetical protein UCDDA912_g04717 [Diaporthe ampelina]
MDRSDAGDEVHDDDSGTGSDSTAEPAGVTLRGGMVTKCDENTSTDPCESVGHLASPPTAAPGKYSRKDLETQDIFWTCSLEEFHAMSDKQWASFGTAFYVAPAGFDTVTKHVVQLE